MNKNRLLSTLLILLMPALVLPQPAVDSWVPTDAQIREILTQRVGEDRDRIGIVVGVIKPAGRRIVAYGNTRVGGEPVDGDTVFEIGSVTKVFTSLLLADMVVRAEVALDDPVAHYLPSSVSVPQRAGRSITLVDLATHTSGLPRLPTNMTPADAANPYADYSVTQIYAQ